MTRLTTMLVLTSALAASGLAAQPACASSADVDQISYVAIRQTGTGNQAAVAGGGQVTLVQSGKNNSASVTQSSPTSERAQINQLGAGNAVTLSQSGDDNTLTLAQLGVGNRATLQQQSASMGANLAALSQIGFDNTASLVQDGDHNSAVQLQVGADDTQSVVQTGSHNNASYTQIGSNLPDLGVVQTGGMSVTIVQTGSPFGRP